jgi:hypothetical protein
MYTGRHTCMLFMHRWGEALRPRSLQMLMHGCRHHTVHRAAAAAVAVPASAGGRIVSNMPYKAVQAEVLLQQRTTASVPSKYTRIQFGASRL